MNVITDFINNGQKIGIAVSGGMDSMALLHWFVKNQSNLNISITAINIDHNIRKNSVCS
jgi:tRNA(Ile)-lysidine synthase/bifunctional protein TilS/HprT